MITEAIILAGGPGTRLRSAVPHLPKCMAPVAGRPFIHYVLKHLAAQGINRFILALGHKAAIIEQYIQQHFKGLNIVFSTETELLGTGGAILKACSQAQTPYTLVTNGDTLYKVSVQRATPLLKKAEPDCLLFLKPMHNTERYGVVEIDDKQQIISFREKQFYSYGLINGGLYLLNVPQLLQQPLSERFSFEKDYLEARVAKGKMYGIQDDAYFIDIGIPADFERANQELKGN